MRGSSTAAVVALAWWAAPGGALAQVEADVFSPDTVHGVADLRGAWADGERSFIQGGFGKARYGGASKVQLADATLEWAPRLGWDSGDFGLVLDGLYQPGQEHVVDLDQAYFVYKPVPRSKTRFEVRGGFFYPPVSLEHDGRGWTVTNTITPSAINSWIGEEVKVAGLEGSVSSVIGEQPVRATGAIFYDDDTSGTLLSFRGWALDDLKAQANGSFPLPPLSPFFARIQGDDTYTNREIDHRPGFYGRVEWTPAPPLTLHAFYYDNRGDRVTVTPDLQWAWATKFWEFGGRWDIDDKTRLQTQALLGSTVMGFQTRGGRFVNMDFRSVYVLGARDVGKSSFTGRLDLFDTHDNSALFLGDTNEHGWALTGAWRYPLTRWFDVRLEALHIDSTRPARAVGGEDPQQAQNVLQSSLRLSF